MVSKVRTDDRVEVVAGLGPTGGYCARTIHAFLVSLGIEVHWVKNAAVHDARDAIYGPRTKTDPVDARLIARLLYLREAVGQEYAFSTGYDQIRAYATLRLLVGNRWRLRQAQAGAGNQLTQILDVVFPELAEVFAKPVGSDAALRLLEHYPTPAALAEADTTRSTGSSCSRLGRPARPAHEHRCPAVGNTDMSVPISAMIDSAACLPTPVMVSRRSRASAKGPSTRLPGRRAGR